MKRLDPPDVGPHEFERLSWLRPSDCALCVLPKFRHPRHVYTPARSWHSRDAAQARARRLIFVVLVALAALALLLVAALPAGGQTDPNAIPRYEGWVRSGGFGQSDWRGQRWVTPPPCETIQEFRCWAQEWLREFPSPLVCCDAGAIGYTLSGPECTQVSCRYPPSQGSSEPRVSDPEPLCRAGNRYLSAEKAWRWGQRHVLQTSPVREVAAASAMLRPYVCGPRSTDVDPRLYRIGDEVKLSDALSSGGAPPPQVGCNLGGWSPEPVSRETCDEILPASRMAGPGADACCHKDNPPGFFPPRPASRTCVERPQCFLGGEPPVDPPVDSVDPPSDPPIDQPAAECDLAAVELTLETLQATLAELLQRLEAHEAASEARAKVLRGHHSTLYNHTSAVCGVSP